MANNLATVAKAQEHNTLSGVDATLLGRLLDASAEWVEEYCNRTFLAAAVTEYHNGMGRVWVYLRQPPINSLTSVTVIDQGDGTEDTVDTGEFNYDSATGEVRFYPYVVGSSRDFDAFPGGYRNIKFVYNGGYSTIPDAVTQATIYRASMLYAGLSSKDNPSLKNVKLGDYSRTHFSGGELNDPEGTLATIKVLLSPYVIYDLDDEEGLNEPSQFVN